MKLKSQVLLEGSKWTDNRGSVWLSYAPYEGANISEVHRFIDEKYTKDKVSIIISRVRFTIYAPTDFVRMLIIQPSEI